MLKAKGEQFIVVNKPAEGYVANYKFFQCGEVIRFWDHFTLKMEKTYFLNDYFYH